MEHAQLMWRKKLAVARLLTRAQPIMPQATNQQLTGDHVQQVVGEQANMDPKVEVSSVHNALRGRSLARVLRDLQR